jgi:tetratricopeptide (TPR) repeat protein
MMRGLLARLCGRAARRRPGATDDPAPDRAALLRRTRLARGLGEALDRAMSLGLLDHANRVADTAAPLAPDDPRLTRRLARLRLAQGDPEEALRIIESCRQGSAALDLLNAVCLLRVGRLADAHALLQRTARSPRTPPEAPLLLAMLEWRGGNLDDACAALLCQLQPEGSPDMLAMLTLLSLHRQQPEEARQWAGRLRSGMAGQAEQQPIDLMLRSLDLMSGPIPAAPSPRQARDLAAELAANEDAIPALAARQQRRADPATVRLLSAAIELALPRLADPGSACAALARLALARRDPEEALAWANRARDLKPMLASAALVIQECRELLQRNQDGPRPAAATGSSTRERAA